MSPQRTCPWCRRKVYMSKGEGGLRFGTHGPGRKSFTCEGSGRRPSEFRRNPAGRSFILRIERGGRPLYYDQCGRWVPWKFRAQKYPAKDAAAAAARPLANALRAPIAVEAIGKASKPKPRAKARKRPRRNPGGSSAGAVRQAKRAYTDFRGEGPRELLRVRLPKKPGALWTLGECIGIMYRTRRDGVAENYLHRFRKKARPTLAVSQDGRQLYLLGGAYSVTDRGIEDADR